MRYKTYCGVFSVILCFCISLFVYTWLHWLRRLLQCSLFICFSSYWDDKEKWNSDSIKERTVTSLAPVLSHNTVYSFLPERYPHKPYVKEDYPRNVTARVNTTVMFNCPTYSDLEPHIQWVKMPHMFEEGTDPMEDNSTLLVQVRGDLLQEQSIRTACTLPCPAE